MEKIELPNIVKSRKHIEILLEKNPVNKIEVNRNILLFYYLSFNTFYFNALYILIV
jgi:hypothetical protein